MWFKYVPTHTYNINHVKYVSDKEFLRILSGKIGGYAIVSSSKYIEGTFTSEQIEEINFSLEIMNKEFAKIQEIVVSLTEAE